MSVENDPMEYLADECTKCNTSPMQPALPTAADHDHVDVHPLYEAARNLAGVTVLHKRHSIKLNISFVVFACHVRTP